MTKFGKVRPYRIGKPCLILLCYIWNGKNGRDFECASCHVGIKAASHLGDISSSPTNECFQKPEIENAMRLFSR